MPASSAAALAVSTVIHGAAPGANRRPIKYGGSNVRLEQIDQIAWVAEQ